MLAAVDSSTAAILALSSSETFALSELYKSSQEQSRNYGVTSNFLRAKPFLNQLVVYSMSSFTNKKLHAQLFGGKLFSATLGPFPNIGKKITFDRKVVTETPLFY